MRSGCYARRRVTANFAPFQFCRSSVFSLALFFFCPKKSAAALTSAGKSRRTGIQIFKSSPNNPDMYPATEGPLVAADVAAEGEEGKHGVAAVFNACRRQRIRARPHQPHRKSAERHAEQRQYRRGRKRDDKVRNHAQYAACRHGFFQVDFFAEFAVQKPRNAHGYAKERRSEQIAQRFGIRPSLFRQTRKPIAPRRIPPRPRLR